MKNAKKILLLVLSLVLLIGVFAVAAFAEEEAPAATVVYPDGSTVDVAVGDTIVGKKFTTETTTEGTVNVYYGEGNTLYKDAGAGWTFTLFGKDQPLTDLTVTEDMVGKKIVAGGVDKVYSAIDIHLSDIDYYKWIKGNSKVGTVGGKDYYNTAFAKAGWSGTVSYPSAVKDGAVVYSEIEVSTTKRVAGDYRVFFYDEASLQKFFSTSASIELGGVALTYQDLRAGSGSSHNVKLYADHEISNFLYWRKDGPDRPNTSDRTGLGSASSGGSAQVYFDLNGHSVINTSTTQMELCAVGLYLYSSQPGAHFFKTLSSTAFYVSDDGVLYLGNKVTNGDYADNLHVHTKDLFSGHYGSGAYIRGGHYYQTNPSAAYLLRISRRVYEMTNASFYVKGGTAVFGHVQGIDGAGVVNGKITVKNCNFYTDGTSSILKNSFTTEATLKFENCNFYGVSTTLDATAGTVTPTGCTTGNAVTYKTATFFDGTTAFYYPSGADDAAKLAFVKAFVEGHPSALAKPYEIENGKELSYVPFPVANYAYDANLNATMTKSGEQFKVYFAHTTKGVTSYATDAQTYNTVFASLFASLPSTGDTEIKMYANISVPGLAVNGTGACKYYLDINGHNLTMTQTQASGFAALEVRAPKFFLFSSRSGGVVDASAAESFLHTNDVWINNNTEHIYGVAYIGERVANGTEFIGNLTVICKMVNGNMHGTGAYYYGTTFVRSENSTSSYFVRIVRSDSSSSHLSAINNCTFIVNRADVALLEFPTVRAVSGSTLRDCNFICTVDGAAPLFNSEALTFNSVPKFLRCNFYNVLPTKTMSSGSGIDYIVNQNGTDYNCSFGFSGSVPSMDLDLADGVTVLAYAKDVVNKEIAGNTYAMNAIMTSDLSKVLKLTWGEESDYWEIGTKPSHEAASTTMIKDGVYYTNPVFDLDSIAQIENGFVIAAGDVIVDIVFKNEQVIAFTYRDTVTDTLYFVFVDECPDEASIGEKFYELFNAPASAYVITMYKDMTITKAMGFGAWSDGKTPDSYNRDYHNSLANGSIVWDLNGTTVTISKDITGLINLAAANHPLTNANTWNAQHPGTVFGFEGYSETYTFTVKSSAKGGKIVNEGATHTYGVSLFGAGEGKSSRVVFEGENLTIDAGNAYVFYGIEMGSTTAANPRLAINGGTYIGGHASGVARFCGRTNVSNATFISTNASATRVTLLDGYRDGTITFDNVIFVAENAAALAFYSSSDKSHDASFNNCVYINCEPTSIEKCAKLKSLKYSGTNLVSTEADLALAYAGADLTGLAKAYLYKTINGVDYKLMGYFADGFATVNWGFGLTENWLIGSKATHENALIDGLFTYEFEDTSVVAGGVTARKRLVGVKNDAIGMSLTLQSQIGLNLIMNSDLPANVKVMVGENEITIVTDEKTGKRIVTYAVAPTAATENVTFTIVIGENKHQVSVSVGAYAKVILEKDAYASARNLTYAMVDYVRAMNPDADFLAGVSKPDGYTAVTIPALTPATEAADGENTESGYFISFQLNGTIAIAVTGGTTETVTLKIANRELTKTMEGGTVVFEPLAVNELDNVFSVTIGETTYEYSLVEYYYAMPTSQNAKVVEALYNYAHHAKAYVIALQEAANGNAENA